MIRKPAVAGTFYPLDKGMLNRQIDEYLDSVIINAFFAERGPISASDPQ